MTKILLVEDDVLLSDMTKELLISNGYEVLCAYSGNEALLMVKEQKYNLILLDLMLPGLSGEIVLENIRKDNDIPIIGVSSKTDTNSKVELIKNGADDYITKPFDNRELLIRISALLRRYQKTSNSQNETFRFKDLSLNTVTMQVRLSDSILSLTRYEYLILKLLISSPNRVFTKDNIFESVWNENFIGDDNAINVHIGNLRKKFLAINPNEQYIQTVWGLGFKMQT